MQSNLPLLQAKYEQAKSKFNTLFKNRPLLHNQLEELLEKLDFSPIYDSELERKIMVKKQEIQAAAVEIISIDKEIIFLRYQIARLVSSDFKDSYENYLAENFRNQIESLKSA